MEVPIGLEEGQGEHRTGQVGDLEEDHSYCSLAGCNLAGPGSCCTFCLGWSLETWVGGNLTIVV